MKILITGGCGFVGTNLVAMLSSDPNVSLLRVLDSEIVGKRAHLGGFGGDFVKGDIRDRATIETCLNGIDAVVHLAADTRVIDSISDPMANFDVNVVGSFNLLEGMRARGIKRLVNASTGGAIIGEATGAVNESMVAAPISPYGSSKLAVEGYCSAYNACYGIKTVSLRFSNVFGPRSYHKGSVVAAFMKALLVGKPLVVFGDGSQVRDYVYVGDICAGIRQALFGEISGPVQLGSGVPTDLNTVIALLRQVTGVDMAVQYEPARVGEIHSTYCDVSKAVSTLGFKPTSDLKEALGMTWNWFVGRPG